MHRQSTLERAYELARSGPCISVDEIRSQLKRERFEAVDGHLHGSMIVGQLRALCKERRARVETTVGA